MAYSTWLALYPGLLTPAFVLNWTSKSCGFHGAPHHLTQAMVLPCRMTIIPVLHLLMFYTPLAVPSKLLLLPTSHGLPELAAAPVGAGGKCNSDMD